MPIFAGKKFSSPPAHRYLQWCGTLTQTLRTQALSRDLQPSGLWGGYGWTLGPDPWSGTGDFHRPADPVPECIQPPWASGSLRYISKARLSLIGSHIRARSVDPPTTTTTPGIRPLLAPPKLLDYILLRTPPHCARLLAFTWPTPQVV